MDSSPERSDAPELLVETRDHIGHGKSLAGAGNAKQNLGLFALLQPLSQEINGFALLSHKLKLAL